jgi:hypothetical protein
MVGRTVKEPFLTHTRESPDFQSGLSHFSVGLSYFFWGMYKKEQVVETTCESHEKTSKDNLF